MGYQEVRAVLEDINPDALLADGFEGALIGYVEGWHPNGNRFLLATYDRALCVNILVTRDGMTHEEAEEFIEFNVTGAYVGPHTPVFLTRPE